ncbi:hypothetical protein VNO78_02101 [Psophocarpus tetragonolobus]|uniref:Uncharacterized protein n=1 Tax=Psophocarpus tetragonolobus TaxID=3891 RepID=A0AAN9XUY0_PSOTE
MDRLGALVITLITHSCRRYFFLADVDVPPTANPPTMMFMMPQTFLVEYLLMVIRIRQAIIGLDRQGLPTLQERGVQISSKKGCHRPVNHQPGRPRSFPIFSFTLPFSGVLVRAGLLFAKLGLFVMQSFLKVSSLLVSLVECL